MLRRDVAELGISDRQLLVLARALATPPAAADPRRADLGALRRRGRAAVRAGRADARRRHRGAVRLPPPRRDRRAGRPLVVLRDGRSHRGPDQALRLGRAPCARMLAQAQEPTTRPAPARVRPRRDACLSPARRTRSSTAAARSTWTCTPARSPASSACSAPARPSWLEACSAPSRFAGGRGRAGRRAVRAPPPRRRRSAAACTCVPEDRHARRDHPRLVGARSNISLPFLRSLFARAGLVNAARRTRLGRARSTPLGVVARDEPSTVEELSGGNQQKVVVGRWLPSAPRVLCWTSRSAAWTSAPAATSAAAPARWRRSGAAVLVLSADVDEVLEVADRVVVLAAGEIRRSTAYGRRDAGALTASIRTISRSPRRRGSATGQPDVRTSRTHDHHRRTTERRRRRRRSRPPTRRGPRVQNAVVKYGFIFVTVALFACFALQRAARSATSATAPRHPAVRLRRRDPRPRHHAHHGRRRNGHVGRRGRRARR